MFSSNVLTVKTAFVPPSFLSMLTQHASLSESSAPSDWKAVTFDDATCSWIASALSSQSQQHQTFDPMIPDSITLIGMSLIIITTTAAAVIWNTQVVPVSRTRLAISKTRGPLKDYLDELRESAPRSFLSSSSVTSTPAKGMNDSDICESSEHVQNENSTIIDKNSEITAASEVITSVNRNAISKNRAFERWLFSDWLNRKPARKAPAVPIFLPPAKWNSGDNPVLVTTAIMLLCVLVTSMTELRLF